MHLSRGSALSLAALAFALLVSPSAHADDEANAALTDGWCTAPEVKGPTGSLKLVEESFDLEVLGGVAWTKLTQAWVNQGTEPITVRFAVEVPGALYLDYISVQIGDRALDGHRGVRQPPNARPRRMSNAVRVKPKHRVYLRAGAGARVALDNDGYTLPVPDASALCAPLPDGSPARPRPAATPVKHQVWFSPNLPVEVPKVPGLVLVQPDPTAGLVVSFEPNQTPPVLRYEVGLPDEASLAVHPGPSNGAGRDYLVQVQPPRQVADSQARQLQLDFILDRSSSMMKDGKFEAATKALLACIDRLGPEDLFNIAVFSNKHKILGGAAWSADDDSKKEAKAWVEALKPGGGTMLNGALTDILKQPDSPEHHRIVIVVTDGMVGDRADVLEDLALILDDARLFGVGIGHQSDRRLINALAARGRGGSVFIRGGGEVHGKIAGLFEQLAKPVVWDLQVSVEGVAADLVPNLLPDVYAQRPVNALLSTKAQRKGLLRLQGETMNGPVQFRANLSPTAPGFEAAERLGRNSGLR